ncbi:MAG: hypothetical protein K9L84_04400 [Candidatus Omnitrophica bacterium]|nr:hypothetical protein [Candidatus Omnitrophota bacterium]MCF7894282.1 hypothetical protein [Candidatus Omnitrophota bacterium]
MDWKELVAEPGKEMLRKIGEYIPAVLGALVILILGWIIAKVIQKLARKFLDLVRFEKFAEKAGISEALSKGNIKNNATQLLSALVYWFIMILVLVMVVNALGLTVASQLLDGLLGYIPNVIAAVFVLVLGLFLANLVSGIVRTAASNAKLPKPEVLAGLSQWAIVIFAVTASLRQLGIAPFLVSTTFYILFGGICLALSLAFGLGGKDVAAKLLEDFRSKYIK